MQRIHAPFDEPTLAQIDKEVEKSGTSRAQWLSSAVGAYLRLLELSKGADLAQMAQDVAQLRIINESLQKENDSLKDEVEHLKISEENARGDVVQIAPEVAQLKSTHETLWRENQKLKKAEDSAREDAAQARRKLGALEDQIAPTAAELEKARFDMILLQHDQAHFQDTIKQKDQEIAFLQAHIAQLTQSISQFALKPGEEEIKKKGWWRFWK
jgi:chromosome segregation ATPase